MKHLLSLEKLPVADIEKILRDSVVFKRERARRDRIPLSGQIWALLFSKSSTRTRVSFEVGIRELGGQTMFLSANELQLGRGEPVQDTARVLGRMVNGAVVRTFAQNDVEQFAEFSKIPTLNALTDEEHPCQILTDIFTFKEFRGLISGKVITFVGDGACNVARSWVFASAKLNFELRIAAPKKYWPANDLLERAGRQVVCTTDVEKAANGADLLYTDVWVSMGKEKESADRLQALADYQVNQKLVKLAKADALVMHCLPAYRGKEIDAETFDAHAETIFTQAENRLHVQKAILNWATTSWEGKEFMSAQNNIYRHVVFFKFRDRTGKETVDTIASAFRALCAELPFVKGFEWGRNSSPENLNEGYTHCFIVTFGSAEDRDAYLPHPAHRAFCQTHLDPNLEKVCVIDYLPNN